MFRLELFCFALCKFGRTEVIGMLRHISCICAYPFVFYCHVSHFVFCSLTAAMELLESSPIMKMNSLLHVLSKLTHKDGSSIRIWKSIMYSVINIYVKYHT